MNINLEIVLVLLFLHWIFDFCLQTDWQAQNKSKNNNALLAHTSIYSLCWIPFSVMLLGQLGIVFVGVTFVLHTLTDYITSRVNTKLWKEEKVHWFFVSIGFDQFLHFTQLLLTFYFLNK